MVFAQNNNVAFVTTHNVAQKIKLNEEQKKRYQYIREHNFSIKNNANTHKPELIASDAK